MTDGPSTRERRRMPRSLLLGVPPLLAVFATAYVYATDNRYVSTENAYVKSEIRTISTTIDGPVSEVAVKDNQQVAKGDLLFRIDPRPFEMTSAAAKAELANVRQRVISLRARFEQSQMEIEAADERIRYLEVTHKRNQNLHDEGIGSEATSQKTEHELTMARRQKNIATQTSQIVLADLGGSVDVDYTQHPLYLQAEAKLRRAQLNLSYAEVRSPADGVLSKVGLEAGEYVEKGDSLFALVTTGAPWVEANFKEVQLTGIKVGQKATIVVDSFPDVVWRATVDSISPATGAEFAILPPQNATGNWVKVVQRIPVKLTFDKAQNRDRLRAGMTATVSIDTERDDDALSLVKSVFAQPK